MKHNAHLSDIERFEDYLEFISQTFDESLASSKSEAGWASVPIGLFRQHAEDIESWGDRFNKSGKKGFDQFTSTFYGWLESWLYHAEQAPYWLNIASSIAIAPQDFFLKHMRSFEKFDALDHAVHFLADTKNAEVKESLAVDLIRTGLLSHNYLVTQEALDAWKILTFNKKSWTVDYASMVFGSILKAMDFTNVLPSTELKKFMEKNMSDLLHCIHMNLNGMRQLPAAPSRLISALKGARLDELAMAYGSYSFKVNRQPELEEYADLETLGIEISAADLKGNMQYAGTDHQWLASMNLLFKRGEKVDLHDVYTPVLVSKNTWNANSIPGVKIEMSRFVGLLGLACKRGDLSKEAALHYVEGLIQTDSDLVNRLLNAGLPEDFLSIGRVREENFCIDLGL